MITVNAPSLRFELTPRIVAAVAHEEGIVLEAYKDSVGVWTWGLGVAATGGHNVLRYKDNPSTLEEAIKGSLQPMRDTYLADVQQAFQGLRLKEHEIAGALSFHWNTGAILTADWVEMYRAGRITEARASYLSWKKPASIIPRRIRDANLFFDGKWSSDMRAPIWSVSKPSYKPVGGRPIDVLPMLQQIMGGQ